ncbi:DNA topoisomerase 2-like [Planococcus citri]|uniref:DNA topoisomerase 2-like n=1 Tax=Planococcus citri TaxID=170843 RepID=UPI0031F9DB4E
MYSDINEHEVNKENIIRAFFDFYSSTNDVDVANNAPRTIEDTYQIWTDCQHVLKRPDTYIGSTQETISEMWVLDASEDNTRRIVKRRISYVPAFLNLFEEILVNAADQASRDLDEKMDRIEIVIDRNTNEISILNNGDGIPIEKHKKVNLHIPTVIFGMLYTSSNYDDSESRHAGGRNGLGAKVCNIFSLEFTVETASKKNGLKFKQTWTKNMTQTKDPKIEPSTQNYTKITYRPDFQRFGGMQFLDDDVISLMSKRAFDIAGTLPDVEVHLNGELIPIKSFIEYVCLYSDEDPELEPPAIHHEKTKEFEVAVMAANNYNHMSFVNNVATTKGGTHLDYFVDIIVKKLLGNIDRGRLKGVFQAYHIKYNLFVFVNCLVKNPTFNSQTKEELTLPIDTFASNWKLSDKFLNDVCNSEIRDRIKSTAEVVEKVKLACTTGAKNIKCIPKLEDAALAATENSLKCTLIVTEGDSAKTLAVCGLSIVGRELYGVYPLQGKLLNVRDASYQKRIENKELCQLMTILGLDNTKTYEKKEQMSTLRYGKLMIMADQDQDGSHIKGLIINFIHLYWPNLLKHGFLQQFVTPIVKTFDRNGVISEFFSDAEFQAWKASCQNSHEYVIKYYKGLGTSTSKEAKEYFRNIEKHQIDFVYKDANDDSNIEMAFSKTSANLRKKWLEKCIRKRKEEGLRVEHLYGQNEKSISYSDFVDKELVLFSIMNNARQIPSLVDGLNPGSRKVIYACLKNDLYREVKVAQLAGSVAQSTCYHHGEENLMTTIVKLAQNYVGSNNINLLDPIGQFGSRLQGGHDAANPRYIYTKLNAITRLIFHPKDDDLLNYRTEENHRIEPEHYAPIIPMILINGTEGIGMGYNTKITCYNPRDVIKNLQRKIAGQDFEPMTPWFRDFKGEVHNLEDRKFATFGEIEILDKRTVLITELPVGVWTQTYKENVLNKLLNPVAGQSMSKKAEKPSIKISGFKEFHTEKDVRFQVSVPEDELEKFKNTLHEAFKLKSIISNTSMCAFDSNGDLKNFSSVKEILAEYYVVRLQMYNRRKIYLQDLLEAEISKLLNQAKYIEEVYKGKLQIYGRSKQCILEELQSRGYVRDPVRKFKETRGTTTNDEENTNKKLENDLQKDFHYLLGMDGWSVTLEEQVELLNEIRIPMAGTSPRSSDGVRVVPVVDADKRSPKPSKDGPSTSGTQKELPKKVVKQSKNKSTKKATPSSPKMYQAPEHHARGRCKIPDDYELPQLRPTRNPASKPINYDVDTEDEDLEEGDRNQSHEDGSSNECATGVSKDTITQRQQRCQQKSSSSGTGTSVNEESNRSAGSPTENEQQRAHQTPSPCDNRVNEASNSSAGSSTEKEPRRRHQKPSPSDTPANEASDNNDRKEDYNYRDKLRPRKKLNKRKRLRHRQNASVTEFGDEEFGDEEFGDEENA